ncbi:MAG TPA: hypothetical protein ENN49_01725 [Bacteroidales bacterium]|nr:hypothetical protein [Bacteroidales bacterium]
MEIDNLTEQQKYSLRKSEVQQLASFFSVHPKGIDILFELSTSDNSELVFHAAWVLESCIIGSCTLLSGYANRLLALIPELRNNSVRSHFCKLFKTWLVANQKSLSDWIDACNGDVEVLIETCYLWLLSSDVPDGVKVQCLEILWILSSHFPWIAEVLPHSLRLIQIDSTPGVKVMVSRISKARTGNGKA